MSDYFIAESNRIAILNYSEPPPCVLRVQCRALHLVPSSNPSLQTAQWNDALSVACRPCSQQSGNVFMKSSSSSKSYWIMETPIFSVRLRTLFSLSRISTVTSRSESVRVYPPTASAFLQLRIFLLTCLISTNFFPRTNFPKCSSFSLDALSQSNSTTCFR